MELIDFSNCVDDIELFDGKAGAKKSIVYEDEKWILKFGKTTKSMKDVKISYTTSPICEYIGSHIYSMLGLPVHNTKLGVYKTFSKNANSIKDYLVVACKNFKTNKDDKFYSFLEVLNNFDPDTNDVDNDKLDLETTLLLLKNNKSINEKEILERFWQMFVVDALINNNDRHLGNFGVIENNGNFTLAPIYDNGAAFYNKIDAEKAEDILKDKNRYIQSFYHSRVSTYSNNGTNINPYKFIESMNNEACNKAVLEIYPKINVDLVNKLIDDIPEEYEGLSLLPKSIKEFYKESFRYGVEEVLKPVYDRLLESKGE